MINLQKTIKRIFLIISVYVILVLSINFIGIPNLNTAVNDIKTNINAINTTSSDMALPSRVLANIMNQVNADASNLSNDNLIDAFSSNLSKLITLNDQTAQSNQKLLANMDSLSKYKLFLNNTTIKNIQAISESQLAESATFKDLISSVTIEEIPSDGINEYVSELDNSSKTLISLQNQLDQQILNLVTWVGNIIIIILILVILMILLLFYRIIVSDQKYILKSFEHMSNRIFDLKKLPYSKPFFEETQIIHQRIQEMFTQEAFVDEVKSVLASSYHIDDVMEDLFSILSKENNIDRIGIAFVDYNKKKFIAEHGVSSYTNILLGTGFEMAFSGTSLTEILATRETIINNDLEAYFEKKPESLSLSLIIEEGIKSNMIVPLSMGNVVFGILFFSSKEKHFFLKEHQLLAEKIVNETSAFLNRAYFTKVILSNITNGFSELVEKKDTETGVHITRMVAYSTIIANALCNKDLDAYPVDNKFVMEVERNASSHDIGKVGIPDSILKKPGKLTPDEWIIMKTHTSMGADIFKSLREGLHVFSSNFYHVAEEIARYHHERWDGSGYPEGLSGHDIPLSARIVAVADVFDALTSKRHYKPAFSVDKALEIIIDSKGTHLDPVLVDVFIENMDKVMEIYSSLKED